MGSIEASAEQHHIVALEQQYGPVPEFDLPVPYTLKSYLKTTTADEVAARIADATIVLVSTQPITTAHLSPECSPRLRLIAVMASGTDHIDLAACRKRGITVCNASRANEPAVSEHAIGLYFAARRRFLITHQATLANTWVANGNCMGLMLDADGEMPLTCEDEVLGLVGYGVIGQRIAELAQGLGMKVMVADRKGALEVRAGRYAFEEVLRESTVLVLILPRTPESLNLISTKELKSMKHSCVLINVARGGIVDENALLDALKERRIAGAAVDVFLEEPAGPNNSVLLGAKASGLNLIATPHAAWIAATTLKRITVIIKDNVECWARGRPVNVVV